MNPKFNKFLTFELTAEEEEVGSTFHPLQLAVLHNRRSEVASQMLQSLGQIDSQDPVKNQLYQAQLTGEMAMMDWIISLAETYEEKQRKAAEEAHEASQSTDQQPKE